MKDQRRELRSDSLREFLGVLPLAGLFVIALAAFIGYSTRSYGKGWETFVELGSYGAVVFLVGAIALLVALSRDSRK